jgi:macrophage erythroblast attacher
VPSAYAAGLIAYAYDWKSPNLIDPYTDLFSESRWTQLADKFIQTHHKLFNLPVRSLLNIYLTAGLSSLKTPCCHSKFISPSSGLGSSRSPSPSRHRRSASRDDYDSDSSDTRLLDETGVITSRGILTGEEGEGDFLRPDRLVQSTLPNTPVCPICSTELNELARNLPYAHHTMSQVDSDLVALPNGRIYSKARLEELNERIKTPKGWIRDPLETTMIYKADEVQKVFVL